MLSDELIEIGEKANPRSNLSQREQALKMVDHLTDLNNKKGVPNNLVSIMVFVIKKLNEKGFKYYTYDLFIGDELIEFLNANH